MKNLFIALFTVIICSALCNYINAQESDFDLSTQRSEKPKIAPVPGKVIDHHGLILNPTPHKLIIIDDHKIDISEGVSINDKHDLFSEDLTFLTSNKEGVKLSVDFGNRIAKKNGIKSVSGAYAIHINEKGISIIGFDERGAFYGIQTLQQISNSPAMADGKLPFMEINDYPDLPNRGVVEGFYGSPWSHQVRLSLIDFYGKFKLNTYIYGPKDDPYHSSPNWRLPYPDDEANNIKTLVEACKRNRVDFVWAIHPGQDIKWNEEDFNNLVDKFNHMYDLGVRNFAIFFDDISGEGTDPVKQTELLNRLTIEFVNTKGDVAPLTMCPTDYSKLWANPSPQGSLAIFGNSLNPDIKIFWTGDYVCSDLTFETVDWINSRIKRPAYYWWNFPVTDYVRHIVMQGPAYGLDNTLTDKDVCGLISNPMEYGEASKLALYGVADYGWNVANYNPLDNWERGLVEIAGNAHDAYRTFAIHSTDTETGYRKDESWETITFNISDWNDEYANDLEKEFENIEKAPSIITQTCNNQALIKELDPWLTEFEKLGTRGKNTIKLCRLFFNDYDNADFWNQYINTLMTDEDRKNYKAHKSGTLKLQPFYENAMNDMALGFLKKLSELTQLEDQQVIQTQNSHHSHLDSLAFSAFDNNLTTSFVCERSFSFELSDIINGCTLLMNNITTPVKFIQYDAKNIILSETTITSPYTVITISDEANKVEIDGHVEIFEILWH